MSALRLARGVVDLEFAEQRDLVGEIPPDHIAFVLLALDANMLLAAPNVPDDYPPEHWREKVKSARLRALYEVTRRPVVR